MYSITKQTTIIPKAIYTSDLLTEKCWISNAIIATKQKIAPNRGIIFCPSISLDNLNPVKFTTANINRNPTLPAVEILSNFKVFTSVIVAIAVISKPIGWFHNLRVNSLGSSSSSAIS